MDWTAIACAIATTGMIGAMFKFFIGRLDKQFEKIDERFEKIDERFGEIYERFEKRFDNIDKRHEQTISQINERFDQVTGSLTEMERQLSGMEKSFLSLNFRISRLEEKDEGREEERFRNGIENVIAGH